MLRRQGTVAELSQLLGEGRIDPFQIYPVSQATPFVHEVIDHAIQYKWPHIVPASTSIPEGTEVSIQTFSGGSAHPVKRAWLQCALEHPVTFYSLAYASSQHLDWLHDGRETFARSELLRLSYKTEAIRLINQHLRELNGGAIPDYLLISILSMGAHGKGSKKPPPTPPPSPNTTTVSVPSLNTTLNPLCKAQMLHFYGSISHEQAHMSALRTLIAHNDGVEGMTMPALRGAVELGDILNSTITHRRPCIPRPRKIPQNIRNYAQPTCSMPLKANLLPSSKRQTSALLEAFAMCRAVSAALIDHVKSPSTTDITITDLTVARNHAHYILLMLPGANGLWGPRFALYECLRITLLIYSDFVFFPLPKSTGVKSRYASMLKTALGCCWIHEEDGDMGWISQAGPLLWCCVVGGLAATLADQDEDHIDAALETRSWLWKRARMCGGALGLTGSGELEAHLADWLWWDDYLGPVVRACWNVA